MKNNFKFTKNAIEIHFNPKFYDLNCVKEAINDFSKNFKFQINTNQDISIIMTSDKIELDKIYGYEFKNYILGLMQENVKRK